MHPISPWPVYEIARWMPLWQATAFFVATFVLEDVATVGAGVLLASGAVSWPVAFGACFPGIWLGDAGLYAVARFGGRKWFERSRLRSFADRVRRSEHWFSNHGTGILVLSRVIPGARLPTYLAAGFLRLPLPRFLLITGLASLIWTLAILALSQIAGVRLLSWIESVRHGTWIILGAIIVVWFTAKLLARAGGTIDLRKAAIALDRWRHWEFWPTWLFYPPVALHYLWLAVKYRGPMLPTAANPSIFAGGIVGESKMATLGELMRTSPQFTADAELLRGESPTERLTSLREICARRGIAVPFILKPDMGQRGAGIKLIRSEGQALEYLEQTSAPLLAQRFAPGPHEAGIFYYRFPHELRGHIFAITEKIFPVITGDGRSTISELIWGDSRARYLAGKYLARLKGQENNVLAPGETLKLVEAGNHAQGCIFRDGMRLLTPALEARIDEISRGVPGFFIGRYDIRYSSENDLCAGLNFQIVELNGAASEATSIYDAKNSIFNAYRTLFRQWELVFAIGAANRRRGHRPEGLLLLWRAWREYERIAATYPAAD